MNYNELKAKRNEIQQQLKDYADLKGHRTYKKLEVELKNIKNQIKDIFRKEHQSRG